MQLQYVLLILPRKGPEIALPPVLLRLVSVHDLHKISISAPHQFKSCSRSSLLLSA